MLADFEICTVTQEPNFFFLFFFGPSGKRTGHKSMGENKNNKKTTVRNLQYGPNKTRLTTRDININILLLTLVQGTAGIESAGQAIW